MYAGNKSLKRAGCGYQDLCKVTIDDYPYFHKANR